VQLAKALEMGGAAGDGGARGASRAAGNVLRLLSKAASGLLRGGLRTNTHKARTRFVPRHPNGEARCWRYEDFDVGGILGSGQTGDVLAATVKMNGYHIALKVVHKTTLIKQRAWHNLRREMRIHASLRGHPNILQFYGYFDDNDSLVMILERAWMGSVMDQLELAREEGRRLSESLAVNIIVQLASALDFCHARGIAHRDIKPENLLLDWQGQLKLADFGTAVVDGDEAGAEQRLTFAGTPDYLAPEVAGNQGHDRRVDVWAVGVLAFELLAGFPPFKASTPLKTCERILKLDYNFPEHFSPEARDFIASLLQLDPADRLDLALVPEHPWVLALEQQDAACE
jgi:serine/threonine protein kinase